MRGQRSQRSWSLAKTGLSQSDVTGGGSEKWCRKKKKVKRESREKEEYVSEMFISGGVSPLSSIRKCTVTTKGTIPSNQAQAG